MDHWHYSRLFAYPLLNPVLLCILCGIHSLPDKSTASLLYADLLLQPCPGSSLALRQSQAQRQAESGPASGHSHCLLPWIAAVACHCRLHCLAVPAASPPIWQQKSKLAAPSIGKRIGNGPCLCKCSARQEEPCHIQARARVTC